jgi:CheY-like chemotaxis protein
MSPITIEEYFHKGDCQMPTVLIAEDDLMIADMAAEALLDGGYEVCGIGRTVAEAVALGWLYRPNLAVIDGRMAAGGLGTEVADQLAALDGLGILYVTGSASTDMLAAARGHACLFKPYCFADLLRSLEIVAEMVTTGTASPPFPRNFEVLPAPMVVGVDHG